MAELSDVVSTVDELDALSIGAHLYSPRDDEHLVKLTEARFHVLDGGTSYIDGARWANELGPFVVISRGVQS